MSQPELLKKVVGALEAAGIEYMITGSLASSMQGEPRSTHDIDVVVALEEDDVDRLARAFPPPRFYLDADEAREAVRRRHMFNLLDTREGAKVDFWLLTDTPFDRSRFSRRHIEEGMGIRMALPRPEDTILAKLRWGKLSGGSEKQFQDALRVYEVQGPTLEEDYLDRWAEALEIGPLLERLRAESEPLP